MCKSTTAADAILLASEYLRQIAAMNPSVPARESAAKTKLITAAIEAIQPVLNTRLRSTTAEYEEAAQIYKKLKSAIG